MFEGARKSFEKRIGRNDDQKHILFAEDTRIRTCTRKIKDLIQPRSTGEHAKTLMDRLKENCCKGYGFEG
jgi:hypothetical protein